ncbi:MAG: putative glycoside hydrolase, partial [Lysobacteraceae bacterium]
VATAPAASADGAIALQAIDHRAQEDARLLQWRGGGGAFELNSIAPLDLRRETNGDVLMVLTVQVRQAPTAPVWLEMGCGGACRGRVRIDGALAALPADGWRRLGVPLKCLQAAGADMGRVVRTLRIDAEGPLALGLSRVELATDPDATVACTTP